MKNNRGAKNKINPSCKLRNLLSIIGTVSILSTWAPGVFAQDLNSSPQTPVLIAQSDTYDDYGNYDDSYDQSYENEPSSNIGSTRSGSVRGVSLFSIATTYATQYLLIAFVICFIAGFPLMCAFFVWNVTKLFSGGRKPKIG